MGRINTVPRGLQGFLGNTNFGDNPSELARETQATIDLNKFLQVDKMRSYISAAVAVAAGNSNVDRIVVPENQLWFLLHVGMYCERTSSSGTGQVTGLVRLDNYPSYEDGGDAGHFISIAGFDFTTWNNNGYDCEALWLPEPFPMPAGVGLSWYIGDMNDPANDDFSCRGSAFFYVVNT